MTDDRNVRHPELAAAINRLEHLVADEALRALLSPEDYEKFQQAVATIAADPNLRALARESW